MVMLLPGGGTAQGPFPAISNKPSFAVGNNLRVVPLNKLKNHGAVDLYGSTSIIPVRINMKLIARKNIQGRYYVSVRIIKPPYLTKFFTALYLW
jgi:hypothetical protein